jgi:hypothetical protein
VENEKRENQINPLRSHFFFPFFFEAFFFAGISIPSLACAPGKYLSFPETQRIITGTA